MFNCFGGKSQPQFIKPLQSKGSHRFTPLHPGWSCSRRGKSHDSAVRFRRYLATQCISAVSFRQFCLRTAPAKVGIGRGGRPGLAGDNRTVPDWVNHACEHNRESRRQRLGDSPIPFQPGTARTSTPTCSSFLAEHPVQSGSPVGCSWRIRSLDGGDPSSWVDDDRAAVYRT